VARPFGRRWRGWACAGSGPNTGSPAPIQRTPEKNRRDRLITLAEQHPAWAQGFADEVWWSRLAQPALHSWADAGQPLRLVEQTVARTDPDPKALACYGLLLRRAGRDEAVWVRFVEGQPVSALTTQFLDWCCDKLERRGVPVWVLMWDNASWHISKAVRAWIRTHNHRVKHQGHGVRILACYLPVKRPWLNPIEPHWIHGKRAIVEPARLLSAQEVAERVCGHFHCPHDAHLSIPDKAA
jgi:transposase